MKAQITSKATALRLLRSPGAEIHMGSSSGKWLWTEGGRRRINEGLVQELEESGEIVRSDDSTSRCGMTWTLPHRGS